MSVAGQVAAGYADAGVGSERGALSIGVEFVPLRRERIDLVLAGGADRRERAAEAMALLASANFQEELRRMEGYDCTETGKLIWRNGNF